MICNKNKRKMSTVSYVAKVVKSDNCSLSYEVIRGWISIGKVYIVRG